MTTKDTIESIGSASAGAGLAILSKFGGAVLMGIGGALGGLILRLIYIKWFKKYFEK